MGPRMREDKGGVFTPILTFPPQGGREGKEGGREGRPYGGRGVRWAVGMAHSNGIKGGWAGGDEIVRGASEWHWGERRKDGSPHARGQGGRFHPHPNLPPSRGEGRGRRVPTRGAPTGGNRVGRSLECHHLGG